MFYVKTIRDEDYEDWINSGSIFDESEIFEKKLKNYEDYL